MNEKEREKAPGEYKRVYDEFVVGNKLIPPHYGTLIEGLTGVAFLKDKMGIEGYQMACNGDFSMFETVDRSFETGWLPITSVTACSFRKASNRNWSQERWMQTERSTLPIMLRIRYSVYTVP